jgi:hypothetical protein
VYPVSKILKTLKYEIPIILEDISDYKKENNEGGREIECNFQWWVIQESVNWTIDCCGNQMKTRFIVPVKNKYY